MRGIAVMLVLCSHHWFFTPVNNMGWIGVDLFFVLSGFLVSGLLFSEYIKYGNIRPKLFLIRRGFKIYPLFYFSIFVSIIFLVFLPDMYFFPDSKILFLNSNGILVGSVIEVFFLQSFFYGFWGHHWSLSVEEFFYFFLALFLFLMIKKKKLQDHKLFLRVGLLIFSLCFILRIISNSLYPSSMINFTGVHLRIDSLFAGVMISYFYYFKYDGLNSLYLKYRKLIWVLAIPLISFTPFYIVTDSFFIKTIGFTLIYISFSFLLLTFLFEKNITKQLKAIITRWLFDRVVKVGFYSYSIYLFHMYIVRYMVGEDYMHMQYLQGNYSYQMVLLSFIFYFFGSIGLGVLMSYLIELPMLRLRDKYFPRRAE